MKKGFAWTTLSALTLLSGSALASEPPDVCGDESVGASETCDEGWMNGQPGHCNSTCDGQTPDQCGDGYVSGDELCDDGSWNGQPYYCSSTCDGYTEWCGDGVVSGAEGCDDGTMNGSPGHCDATCTSVPAGAPFTDPAKAPVIRELSYGQVLGTRDYQVPFSLGELPGVGLAPGFGVSIRLRTGSDDGLCGTSCDLLLSSVEVDGADYVVVEAGGARRRFSPSGSEYTEIAPRPGVPFKPATAVVTGGSFVLTEVGGTLARTFDAAGLEVSRATPWGSLTIVHDGQGRLTSATNAAGKTLSVAYNAAGRVASVTDPTGFTMSVVYSADGKVISVQGPPDGGVTPNISIGWSGDDIVSVARLGINPVQITYDNGLVAQVNDSDGNSFAFQGSETEIEVIDSAMQYEKLTYSGDDLVSIEGGDGTALSYQRDALGRLVEVRYATGGSDLVQTMTYDAGHHLVSSTNPDGYTFSFTYDAAGNMASQTDPEGHTTTFTYDAADHLISTTDPLGRTSTTSYDSNGLPTSTSFLGVTTQVTYDARGQVATSTDEYGVTTTFGYDSEGRMTQQARPGMPTVTITRTPQGDGQLVVVTRGGESSSTLTDRYGRVVSTSSSLGAASMYAYDPVTGLRSGATETFRGATRTKSQTFTNTGDAAQVWVNGQLRQSAPRTVPPGNAWFPNGMQ
ncbi:MAG: hypothetical protein R3B70_32995 [Polyangiaceae bacterium]